MASESTFRTVDDGGYAFPQANGGGMTLLEYYASQALASGTCPFETRMDDKPYTPKTIAKFCFDIAEAMIAEHERRTSEPKPEIPKQDIKSTVITCRNCNRRKVVDVPELCNECL